MVLYVLQWDILTARAETYPQWAQGVIPRTLGVPGVVEFRAYRPATGTHQVVITYEFANMADWAAWQSSETIQQILDEVHLYTTNLKIEVWGPSPIVPQPIRPGG